MEIPAAQVIGSIILLITTDLRDSQSSEHGGYVKTFDYNNGSVIVDVLTIKGAGHMVPIDRPGPILQVSLDYYRKVVKR